MSTTASTTSAAISQRWPDDMPRRRRRVGRTDRCPVATAACTSGRGTAGRAAPAAAAAGIAIVCSPGGRHRRAGRHRSGVLDGGAAVPADGRAGLERLAAHAAVAVRRRLHVRLPG